jgi:hypothetical protein
MWFLIATALLAADTELRRVAPGQLAIATPKFKWTEESEPPVLDFMVAAEGVGDHPERFVPWSLIHPSAYWVLRPVMRSFSSSIEPRPLSRPVCSRVPPGDAR